MKRRQFFRSILLGSVGWVGATNCHSVNAVKPKFSLDRERHSWVILYWMPYDNDLSHFGEPIVKMLLEGTLDSEAIVVVQSDYWGDSQMRRRQIFQGKTVEIEVTGEDSSDVAAFSAYLEWATQTFVAEHWAIVVVGHGGKINEISPDEHSTTYNIATWMRLDRFSDAVSQFNRSNNGRVELLFFQNCNKATLEVIYEARNCARYTLASQLLLGAPNYYYRGFLAALNDPSVGGREAAIAIMNSERDDMYHSLTLVDNQAVDRIPEKLAPLLREILENPPPNIDRTQLSTYDYFGEQQGDTLLVLRYLSQFSKLAQTEFEQFADFLRSSVIARYQTGGTLLSRSWNYPNLDKFCGLGLYVPQTPTEASRYSSLALYPTIDLIFNF